MNVLTNNGTFFPELRRITSYERLANNTRATSLASTRQNEPLFQDAENKSRNYARKGQQIFTDPFASKSRGITFYNEGRNLFIIKELEKNQVPNTPDVISIYNLRVLGKY